MIRQEILDFFPQGAESQADTDLEFLRCTQRPEYEVGTERISIVDLFSGCGGMTLGVAHAAHRSGFAIDIPLAVDLDTDSIEVFRSNFQKANCVQGDVCDLFNGNLYDRMTTVERRTRKRFGTRVDFLLGGPPCQGNSDLNNHSRRNDPRNELYARMARASRVLEPKIVIIENVPAVLHDRGRVVDSTFRSLENTGYDVADEVLELSRLGVPQIRRRHILVASSDPDCDPEFIIASLKSGLFASARTVRWAIGDLAKCSGDTDFDQVGVQSSENKRRIQWLFDHNLYDLPDEHRPPCHRDKPHSYKSIYGRLHWDKPAQTITTGFGSMGQGRFVHPSKLRTITPHEAARLQCFPDFFSFLKISKRSAWSRLIGNAVPPFLTLRIGELIFSKAPRPV